MTGCVNRRWFATMVRSLLATLMIAIGFAAGPGRGKLAGGDGHFRGLGRQSIGHLESPLDEMARLGPSSRARMTQSFGPRLLCDPRDQRLHPSPSAVSGGGRCERAATIKVDRQGNVTAAWLRVQRCSAGGPSGVSPSGRRLGSPQTSPTRPLLLEPRTRRGDNGNAVIVWRESRRCGTAPSRPRVVPLALRYSARVRSSPPHRGPVLPTAGGHGSHWQCRCALAAAVRRRRRNHALGHGVEREGGCRVVGARRRADALPDRLWRRVELHV